MAKPKGKRRTRRERRIQRVGSAPKIRRKKRTKKRIKIKKSKNRRSFKKTKKTKKTHRKKRMRGGAETVAATEPDFDYKSVTISGSNLKYFTDGVKYISTFNWEHPLNELKLVSDKYYDLIYPQYRCHGVKTLWGTCGANCQKLCKENDDLGILYMTGAPNYPPETQLTLESVYGSQNTTMAVSYHALVYTNSDGYFVAIEVSSQKPYHMQFYISDTQEDLFELIKVRYNVTNLRITMNCDETY